jgi:phage host-nuclease inhibitor protein Gam
MSNQVTKAFEATLNKIAAKESMGEWEFTAEDWTADKLSPRRQATADELDAIAGKLEIARMAAQGAEIAYEIREAVNSNANVKQFHPGQWVPEDMKEPVIIPADDLYFNRSVHARLVAQSERMAQSRHDDRTATLDAKPEYDAAPVAPEPVFVIDSEERANWYLRKLGNIDAERARVKAQAAAIADDLDREYEGLEARHQADLEVWANANLPKGKKSIKLLQGTVAFRNVPTSISVADKEAALQWAKYSSVRPDLVVITESIDTEKYKALFKETGQYLPGIKVTAAHESCKITFGKKE